MATSNLGITIREALKTHLFGKAELVAGKGGIDRRITQVNIMEVPDILKWVHEGEFLLTTLYSIKDDINAQKNLIPALNSKGLSGIGIKPGRYVDEIPAAMIQTADELNMPLLKLPLEVSFSDIINAVLLQVFDKYAAFLQHSENIHRRFMDVVLFDEGIESLTRILAQIINNPVMLVDLTMEQKYSGGTVSQSAMEEALAARKAPETTKQRFECYRDRLEGTACNGYSLPIEAGSKFFGYIHVWEKKAKLRDFDLRSIEHCSTVAALEMLKQRAILEVEARHQQEFIEDLLSTEPQLRAAALERNKAYKFDTNIPHAVCILQVQNVSAIGDPVDDEVRLRLARKIENFFKMQEKNILLGSKTNSIFIVCPQGTDARLQAKEELSNLCRQMFNYLAFNNSELNFQVGVGRVYRDPLNLWKSMLEARKALAAAINVDNGAIIPFDDLGVYRLLSHLANNEEAKLFWQDILEQLIKYDDDNGTELLHTLEEIYQCGGNLKKVAKKMYVHYNTVLYRAQRIEEILKLSLSNPEDRLCIELALKLYKLNS